jgi:hypothetical protein
VLADFLLNCVEQSGFEHETKSFGGFGRGEASLAGKPFTAERQHFSAKVDSRTSISAVLWVWSAFFRSLTVKSGEINENDPYSFPVIAELFRDSRTNTTRFYCF